MEMKQDALLRARADTLNEFIDDEDTYEIAIKAVDTFLDILENYIQTAESVEITETGALEITFDNDSSI